MNPRDPAASSCSGADHRLVDHVRSLLLDEAVADLPQCQPPCCYNKNMEREPSAEGVAAETTPPTSSKNIIWTIIGVMAVYAFLGPLGAGLGLMIFVIRRRSLNRTQRIRLSVLAGVSILYGLAFSQIPWRLIWLTSTPSIAVTHA